MTSQAKRMITVLAVMAAAAAPTAARAALIAPAGPWPTTIAGATNPLGGTSFFANGGNATHNASLRVWLPRGRAHLASIARVVGGRTAVRGRLQNRDNRRSISGATVQLIAQEGPGGDWSVVAVARTNRKGVFRAVLPAGGSRRVAVLYWPDASAGLPLFSRRLLVRATPRVYLRTTMLKGHVILYRGRVSGAPIPDGGLVLAAEVRNGRVWNTLRIVRTQASGRFVARYRFKYGGRRYKVRALVPAQPSWPFFSGHSQPQRVRSR
jgi:hypothetical protein